LGIKFWLCEEIVTFMLKCIGAILMVIGFIYGLVALSHLAYESALIGLFIFAVGAFLLLETAEGKNKQRNTEKKCC
jgi:hypothetical protein